MTREPWRYVLALTLLGGLFVPAYPRLAFALVPLAVALFWITWRAMRREWRELADIHERTTGRWP